MKIRFTIAVGLIALGLLSAVRPVGAQTPVATATPLPWVTTAIPEQVPANWSANGMTQGEWTTLRQHCVDIFADIERNRLLPPAQRLKSSHSTGFRDTEDCLNLAAGFRASNPPGPTSAPTIAPAPVPFLPPPPPPASTKP